MTICFINISTKEGSELSICTGYVLFMINVDIFNIVIKYFFFLEGHLYIRIAINLRHYFKTETHF